MKKNVRNPRRTLVLILAAMMLSTLLSACVDLDAGGNVGEISVDISATSSEEESRSDEISTPEGYAKTPEVKQIINISPSVVAICGACEDGATVSISGGTEDVSVLARGEYFIAEVGLKYESSNLLEITASVEGKETSLAGSVIAYYNATADKRLDGNSVSVGTDSRLYFDKMVDDASGKNLFTVSELKQIRTYTSNMLTAYSNRANGESVELIYVLVPNVTTIYPEIFPEGIVDETNTTLYDQILDTLSQTRATVIDMREIFMNVKDEQATADNGGLYRTTDSSITDYAGFLAYTELMKAIAVRFPDSAPRAFDEFTFKNVGTVGGNLAQYRGIEAGLVGESISLMTPKFNMDLGANATGETKISSIFKYVNSAEGDYTFFTTTNTTDNINGVAERWLVNTERQGSLNLPNALIYRDSCSFPVIDIVAERFNTCLLAKSGDFDVNLSNAIQYSAEGKSVTDYIIVFLSEENMDTAFSLAFAE